MPFSENLFWTLKIAFSFPGIFLLENIIVSPLISFINLSVSLEILESAEFGSPCDPVDMIRTLFLGIRLKSFNDNKSGIFFFQIIQI